MLARDFGTTTFLGCCAYCELNAIVGTETPGPGSLFPGVTLRRRVLRDPPSALLARCPG